jgi:hypothetical protein
MVAIHNLGKTVFYNAVTRGILGIQQELLNVNQLAYLEYKWGKKVKRRPYELKNQQRESILSRQGQIEVYN